MTPDVNLLVAAFRPNHPHHGAARNMLTAALESCGRGGTVELLPMVAASFLRLVTNPKVFPVPAPIGAAAEFLRSILNVPGATMPQLGPEWARFEKLAVSLSLKGNQIPDAWIAAAVSVGGYHLVTFDAGFTKYLHPAEFTLLGTGSMVREPNAEYGGKGRGRKRPVRLDTGPAMRRAAKRAREVARRFGTPVWVMRKGKIVAVKP